jgi:predicted MPP superfamily phosphohydrolase
MSTFLFFIIFFMVVDFYLFQAVISVSHDWSPLGKKIIRYGFWIPTVLSVAALLWWMFADPYRFTSGMRNWVLTGLFATYFSKIFGILFLFADDIQRGLRWVVSLFKDTPSESLPSRTIPRSEFLTKAALIATAVPFGTMAYGIISGAHDYRLRRVKIKLPNLPKSFHGIRIGQISDIHSGSFFNKTAVRGGVDLLMNEKPDLIFFTGDLVNNEAVEIKEYFNTFGRISAPLGVFSVTGNHDYGDYHHWPSAAEKRQNFQDLMEAHRRMGYRLLMNEHEIIRQGNGNIAVVGNENWGGRGFSKYGKLDQAMRGAEEADVRLLLSHDPSHWDAQVRPQYPEVDVTFAGHTHGFQFGVEIGGFRWSPSQYVYKQWAGLYQEGTQYLYVNRGFGYLGYPGRIGMPPELTIFELERC